MQTIIPAPGTVFKSLLKADFITQWRNRRSVTLVVLVPLLILISWQPLIKTLGGPFVLSNCITNGLTAIGLMAYCTSIARDRDKGIFQRIRVAPVPSWSIMTSRITVQLAMICIMTLTVFIVGYAKTKIILEPAGYVFGFLATLAGGVLYLGLGQAIVGLVKNSETVNATSRLVYSIFILVGMLGEMGKLGKQVALIAKWSPYGIVRRLISDSLQPAAWNMDTNFALLATIGYATLFVGLGIWKFKWETK
jgi:ABC-2 type transport system permease protein